MKLEIVSIGANTAASMDFYDTAGNKFDMEKMSRHISLTLIYRGDISLFLKNYAVIFNTFGFED